MKTHDFPQKSAPWLAYRATARNASDAAAMLGCSIYMTRDDLLKTKATGLRADVTAAQQTVFDRGHAIEEITLPAAESVVGEDLFPVVGSEVLSVNALSADDGIELSASFDGLTVMEDTAWECKSLNDALRAVLPHPGPDGNDARQLPKQYRVQMEQQCAVSGCSRVLFTASDGKGDMRHCWYQPDPDLRRELIAGWKQFDADLAEYELPAATVPAPTGRTPDTLPALFITVKGEVTASNLAEFKETALTAIRSVNRELTTDQDFADAKKAVKWCEEVESRLKASKEHALSQTASIDQLFKVMDEINAEARATRLDLDKLVKARELSLKSELLIGAQTALGDFLRAKNAKLGRDYMPQISADFAGAIHGKKSFDNMRSALNAALANAKIEANRVCDKIEANLAVLREKGKDHGFLFNDVSQLVLMENDHLDMLVDKRIGDHVAETARKEQETRDRIRQEEQAKAEKDAREKLQAEQQAEDNLIASIWALARRIEGDSTAYILKAKAAFETGAKDFEHDERPRVAAAVLEARAELAAKLEAAQAREATAAAPAPAPAATPDPAMQQVHAVVRAATPPAVAAAPAPRPQAKPDTPPSLSLGQIGARLGFSLTAAFLSSLGFEGEKVKGAVLFHEHQFDDICVALIKHVEKARELQPA